MRIELDYLGEFAERRAAETEITGAVSGKRAAGQIAADLKRIKRASAKCAGDTKAEEWLLDNWYIADREGQSAQTELRRAEGLPSVKGRAAVMIAAEALVKSGEGEVRAERLSVFLNGWQSRHALSEGELSAFIPAVKASLVHEAAEECGRLDSEKRMENIFTSLRFLEGFRAGELMDSVSRVETLLRTDPAGTYSRMDEETRRLYRRRVSELAEKNRISEYEAAKRATELAGESGEHVGVYLFKKPLGRDENRRGPGVYISSMVIISLFLTVLVAIGLNSPLVGVLILLPVWEMVKNVFDFLAVKTVSPDRLPRMELKNGIPAEGKTLCVISVLLTGRDGAKSAAGQLEQFSITNREAGRNLSFGLLADLKEADSETEEGDRELLDCAAGEIEKLNEKYGGGFYLLTRKRVWCKPSGKYMGWERKRGAILELARLCGGHPSGAIIAAGDTEALQGTKYILTLDSDTRLTAGAAVQLVGAALHPLNRPVIRGGVTTEGYGIFAPRMSVELKSAGQSDFTRIFAGQGGIDPYGGSVSDVYQDMFHRGSFTGKGLIDVDTYLDLLDSRFPENRVLSHDLLEGAFMGCGFMGDVELADSTPGKVTSHYERMHRWVRGDWQNACYMGRRIPDGRGGKTPNPLSDLDRWKVFDNLRRSLTPVMTMLSLLVGMLTGLEVFGWVGAIAVVSQMSQLLITSAELLFKKRPARRTRYLSNIVSGFGGMIMQTIIRLMLLPYEAWICLSAIVTALYRTHISCKNLLQWTTAADSDRGQGGVWRCYRKMAACPVTAAVIFLISPYAAGVAVGIVWLLTPFYAWALSKRIDRKKHISESDRRFLINQAGSMWRYFEDNITAAESFLPPDNVQIKPNSGPAHRTSPTNIGLALLSALGAIDLGLTDRQKAVGMIENMLESVRRLDKWNGHLYNWYDTRTMRPLEPAYVSTVDSGNLAGCLAALREGLLELGEERLADMAWELYLPMSFTTLYDKERGLFYIGWDAANNRPTRSYYDLLASEARQTSFVAIARGDVPRKHWRALSRALVSADGYYGMASWTGTMFEYLMPNLLLPCYQDSLLYESSNFCVFVQNKDKREPVWGTSESGYYEFDSGLNYRYKAHGMETVALKRGMGKDSVISPYSSFLALTVDFRAALSNLRAIQAMGAEGKYGMYEAIDFTPARRGEAGFQIVRSFMVHHLGMSILAVDNVLSDNIMQKRFMKNVNMASYSELLQEKIPAGSVVLRRRPREVPEKPDRRIGGDWTVTDERWDDVTPACGLVSNGAYSVLVTGIGQSRSQWGDMLVTRFVPEQDSRWRGVDVLIKTPEGDLPITRLCSGIARGSEFTAGHARLTARNGKTAAAMTVTVPDGERGELRTISVSRTLRADLPCEIELRFTPVLTGMRDFEAHPMFSKLCLEAERSGNVIVIKRRSRGDRGEVYLAAALDKDAVFSTEKGEMKRYSTLMEVSARVSINVPGGGEAEVRAALAVDDTAQGAREAALRILRSSETRRPRLEAAGRELGMGTQEIREALELLTGLVYVTPSRRELMRTAVPRNREELWQFGISGDLPILAAEVRDSEDTGGAMALVRQHELLCRNGFMFDLVLLSPEGGDYRRPLSAGGEYVFIVNDSEENRGIIRAFASEWRTV